MASNPAQTVARGAGIAYLVTIAAGMFAEAYARAAVRADGPSLTTRNLLRLESLYRWGTLADMVMIAAYGIVTVLLYRLFKPVNATISLMAAVFSLLGLALLLGSSALLLVPLQQPSLANDALRLHGAAYNLTGLFFGGYCLLIGWLARRSGLLPTLIALLMALAGLVFIVDSTLTLVAPALARAMPDAVMLVSLVGEGALAIWLTLFGVRRAAA